MLDEGGTYNSAAFLGFDVCSSGIQTPTYATGTSTDMKLRCHS